METAGLAPAQAVLAVCYLEPKNNRSAKLTATAPRQEITALISKAIATETGCTFTENSATTLDTTLQHLGLAADRRGGAESLPLLPKFTQE